MGTTYNYSLYVTTSITFIKKIKLRTEGENLCTLGNSNLNRR